MVNFLLYCSWISVLAVCWGCSIKYLFGMEILKIAAPGILVTSIGIGLIAFLKSIEEE